MARKHISNYGVIREYKNGNITIKCDPVEFSNDPLLAVSELLFWVDTYFGGEYLDVWNPSQLWYNVRLDRCYQLYESDIKQLEDGLTVRLLARIPDEYDKELMKESGVL